MNSRLKVLCSPVSLDEARLLVDLGVDIIDLKNPVEGSLGAQAPWVVRDVVDDVSRRGRPVSATLGDLPFKPGTAALAAYGLAQLGVQYIKVGLHGTQTPEQAKQLLAAIRQAIDMVDSFIALVAAGYADYRSFGGLHPSDLVHAAAQTRCQVVMLDTADKQRGSIFDVMADTELQVFIAQAREVNLKVALAGSIDFGHVSAVHRLAPDILGARGGLCRAGDRMQEIDPDRARSFLMAARSCASAPARIGPEI